jgi:hypothetical protein
MNTKLPTKINRLLQKKPQGTLFLSSWLLAHGISYDLQRSYKNSQWFASIASGVMYRTGDTPTIYNAVACLNQQDGKHFHIGAMTALDLQSLSHYVPMGKQTVVIFLPKNEQLPKWLLKRDWNVVVRSFTTNNFNNDFAITAEMIDGFTVLLSERERAFMECLHLASAYYNLTDLYYVMESLTTLRPNVVQKVLENCTSVKIKRLFLFMAEKAEHNWLKYLDLSKIDLGKGKRAMVKNGVYNSKYQITIPKDLHNYE